MKKGPILILLLVISALTLILSPMLGMKKISLLHLYGPEFDEIEWRIFRDIRLPRTFTAFLAGTSLALSGMALQAMFRNPLATPFTLGVSSGASFGAAVYMIIGAKIGIGFFVLGVSGQSVFAFFGSALAILIVYGLTKAKRGFSTATMLLAGVAVSFFFASLILFIQYISDFTQTFRIMRWLMGGFDVAGFRTVFQVLPFALGGSAIVFFLTRELNLLTTGDEIAASRGVQVRAVKKMLFFATSLMVGGVVAVCGPIGFVGMMVPHISRLIIGPDHRYLAPATLLFGGMFLTLCDTLSRTLIAPAEIPVGVITALLGGPFFIWLLISGSSERSLI